uniref:CSON013814 protein n=1 Tax=Culicoides sonorensis TaxID=179676 RepID=A0A336M9Q4_CULSO
MSEYETKKKKNQYKIIIIGAGISGLSSGVHLLQNNISDFLILEARNRIGGRIISIDMGGKKVELGANWIHGILGNPVFELAMQNGLVNVVNIPKQHKIVAATEDGKQIPFVMLQEIYEAYCCFLRRCEEYFVSDYLPPVGISSVGEHINLEIELYLKNVSDTKEKSLKRQIFDCLLKRETCITGCHTMNEIDLLELGSYTELQGGNIVLPSGYSSILTPLVNMLTEDKIVKNCPVKSIHWRRKQTPKKCIFTTWRNQPFSRGSYTSIAVGASQDDIESIAQPLYSSPHQQKPSVLFAGEHTHSNFYSTAHGAYLSGRTAAQIIYEPDTPQEICIETDSSDLSSWLAGIALD